MSLFNTIAHPDAPQARGLMLKGFGMIAAGLVVGATIGVVATVNWPTAERQEPYVAVGGGLTHDEFVRINTTDLEYPPAVAPASGAPAAVDRFTYLNIDSFEGLVPASGSSGLDSTGVSDDFLDWNVSSLEYSMTERPEQPGGPR